MGARFSPRGCCRHGIFQHEFPTSQVATPLTAAARHCRRRRRLERGEKLDFEVKEKM